MTSLSMARSFRPQRTLACFSPTRASVPANGWSAGSRATSSGGLELRMPAIEPGFLLQEVMQALQRADGHHDAVDVGQDGLDVEGIARQMAAELARLAIAERVQHRQQAYGDLLGADGAGMLVDPLLAEPAHLGVAIGLDDVLAVLLHVLRHGARLVDFVAAAAGKDHAGMLGLQRIGGRAGDRPKPEDLDLRIRLAIRVAVRHDGVDRGEELFPRRLV